MSEPTLFDYLEAAVETVTNVAPNLFSKAHPAGDLVAQDDSGNFSMGSLVGRGGHRSAWAFLDLGGTLAVLTCATHGNTIDAARARALGERLIAWADRSEARRP